MKRVPITEEQEEIEIDDVVEFVINHHCSNKFLKKQKFKNFIQDTLDPRHKFVIRGYDRNKRIFVSQTSDLSDSSKFLGNQFKKIKLQARLENEDDVDKLIKFLNFIARCFKEDNQEEIINENRNKVLNDILDNDDRNEFVIPKIKMNF